jgi:hypothetical protein
MIRQEHIEKMQLFGRMLGPTADRLPATAVNAGIEYAQRLTTDTALQAEVKAAFPADLAARDLKRAAEVLAKYGKAKEPVKVATPTPEPVKPTPEPRPKLNVKELEALDILAPNTSGYYWTVKGEAWKDAARPNPHTWEYIREKKAATPPQPAAPPPDLTEFKTYFPNALTYGSVSFEKVPHGKLKVNGKHIKEVMITAGLIDSRLFLTDKGKTWLTEAQQ